MGTPLRQALLAVVAGLSACAGPSVVRDGRVAIRQRSGDADSALVVLYEASVCSLTFRDRSGRLHDGRSEDGKVVPSDMTREMPGPERELPGWGDPRRLLTVFAFPPGRYEIVEIERNEDPYFLDDEADASGATPACGGRLQRLRVSMPFRIERGVVTLLAIPDGPMDFDDLTSLRAAKQHVIARRQIGSWYPLIDRAGKAEYRGLVERQRERREGYDVIHACDHKTAVVRTTGKLAQWEKLPETGSASGTGYYRPQFGIPSVHATGFGGGCVRPWAYHLMLSDPAEVPAATRAIGAWLVENDVLGEIDLVISGIPELL